MPAAQGQHQFIKDNADEAFLSQTPAADLMATLTVTPAADGSSLLRVSLNNTVAVERVRIPAESAGSR